MPLSNKRHYLTVMLAATCAAYPVLSSAEFALEEVVVTGTKRQMTLQEVPIAVSVTTSETIEQAAIQDIGDLQSVVPTLRVTQLQSSGNTNFAIRGFGNGTNNWGIESSVGVFIDGVYRSRAGAAISDLPRLERVEVLSGPQSTLFGKNASAGVISVVTPAPSGETGGYISANVTNFNGYKVSGLFESAISDDLSFDISGNVNQRDGYFDNSFDGSEQNDKNRWGVRGQLFYMPSDTIKLRVIADYDEIDEVCCGTTNLQSGPTEPAIRAVGGELVPNAPFSRDSYLDIEPFNEVANGGVSAQLDIDYENFTLTSITSFRTSDNDKNVDIDYTSAELTSSGIDKLSLETFTQEFRLTSNSDGDVDWMIGGFYFNEDLDFYSEVEWGEDTRGYIDGLLSAAGLSLAAIESGLVPGLGFAAAPIGTYFADGTGARDTITQSDEALSLFTTVDWHINDALTATVGLNYTKAEKEVTLQQVNDDAYADLPPLPGTLGDLQIFTQITPLPNSVEDNTTDDDDVTYTFRLAYDVNDSVNVYASTSTGFKASSWNLSRDSLPGTRFASPEEAEVFEIGLKATFERGSFNMAIFDQTIEGFQSSIFNGTGFNLLNAGEQSTVGAEFDLTYYPVDSLKLTLSGIFLDPEYDSFPEAVGVDNVVTDLSGQAPAGIHEVSLSTSATYNFQLSGHDAYVRGDYQYEDEVRIVENVPESIASREVKLLNLSAGITLPGEFDVSVWVRNVTDEDYLLSAFPTPVQGDPGGPVGTTLGSYNGYPNQPRTYGLGVKKTF